MANKVHPASTSDGKIPATSCDINLSPSKEDEERSIDEVLTDMGSGRFQIIVEIIMVFMVIATTYNFALSYFTADNPPWKCTNRNSSQFCLMHGNKSIHSDSDLFERRCKMHRDEWTYTTPKYYSYAVEFDLVCDKSSTAAFASSALYMGGVVGSLFSGSMSDTYGRRPVIVLSLFVMICCSLGCTFVSNIWQICVINVVLGASVVACYFTEVVYVSEFASPRHRTIFCNVILVSMTWSWMLMDGVAYFERSWRVLQRYLAALTVVAFISSLFVPESPRWLLVTDKKSEAIKVLERVNAFNGNRKCSICLKSASVVDNRKYTYLDLCRDYRVILLTLCLGILWMTFSTVYYYIVLESSNIGGDMYQAFLLSSLADMPAIITCTYLCNRFGRKKCIIGALVISGVLVGLVSIIPRSAPNRYVINLCILTLARFVSVNAFFGSYMWTVEIYPTVLRSQGTAVCTVFERVGLLTVPFIIKVLQEVNYKYPFILMCAMSFVGAGVATYLPETNRRPTREKYEDFFRAQTSSVSNGGHCTSQIEDNEIN